MSGNSFTLFFLYLLISSKLHRKGSGMVFVYPQISNIWLLFSVEEKVNINPYGQRNTRLPSAQPHGSRLRETRAFQHGSVTLFSEWLLGKQKQTKNYTLAWDLPRCVGKDDFWVVDTIALCDPSFLAEWTKHRCLFAMSTMFDIFSIPLSMLCPLEWPLSWYPFPHRCSLLMCKDLLHFILIFFRQSYILLCFPLTSCFYL